MKRILFGLMFVLMISGMASASYLGATSQLQATNDEGIANQTLTVANTIYAVTPESSRPIGGVDMQAVGQNIYRIFTGSATTASSHWTILNGSTKTFPSDVNSAFGTNKTFYFWAASVPCTVEVHYWVY